MGHSLYHTGGGVRVKYTGLDEMMCAARCYPPLVVVKKARLVATYLWLATQRFLIVVVRM